MQSHAYGDTQTHHIQRASNNPQKFSREKCQGKLSVSSPGFLKNSEEGILYCETKYVSLIYPRKLAN